MAILTIGIDLAKNVFAVHGVGDSGKPELKHPSVPRAKLVELVAALPPCTIGMEACSGAHHWARLFAAHGHTVRLMAPKFVAPYRLAGRRAKNDAADAAAICEAVTRPNMLFVPVKSCGQQQRLMVHRARQGFIEARTATLNRIRGLLSEFGIVLPLKAATVRREAAQHLEDLPGYANLVIGDLLSEVTRLDERKPRGARRWRTASSPWWRNWPSCARSGPRVPGCWSRSCLAGGASPTGASWPAAWGWHLHPTTAAAARSSKASARLATSERGHCWWSSLGAGCDCSPTAS